VGGMRVDRRVGCMHKHVACAPPENKSYMVSLSSLKLKTSGFQKTCDSNRGKNSSVL
jgi:hypothetical protein